MIIKIFLIITAYFSYFKKKNLNLLLFFNKNKIIFLK